ncbi:MAG: carboxypeptidase-like regulatory domain-containing protein [Planctomycetota bacterium]|nr:carboxypeptidase-like regulatory domain-containing protein [Planctomycetota bacterium]
MYKPSVIVFALVSLLVLNSEQQGSAEELPHPLTVTQWVQPKEPGVFEARIVVPRGHGEMGVVEDARVRLAGANGLVRTGVTDEKGEVKIKGVVPGVYTLLVQSKSMIGWQAMHVVGPDQASPGTFSQKAVISPALISTSRFRKLVKPFGKQKYTLDDLSIKDVDVVKIASEIRGNERAQVMMHNRGLAGNVFAASSLMGATDLGQQVSRLKAAPDTNVFLIRNGAEIGQKVTDSNGSFFFADLRAGVYSLIMANRDGLAAVSFELLDDHSGVNAGLLNSDGKSFVSFAEVSAAFCCQVGPDCCDEEGGIIGPIGGAGLLPLAALGAIAGGGGGYSTPGANTPGTDAGGN